MTITNLVSYHALSFELDGVDFIRIWKTGGDVPSLLNSRWYGPFGADLIAVTDPKLLERLNSPEVLIGAGEALIDSLIAEATEAAE